MADQRALVGAAIAGTSLLGAWRSFRRADGTLKQLRALLSLVAAVGVAYGAVQALRGTTASQYR